MDSYNTIQGPVENILLKEKGSKFFGFAFPVNSEDETKTALEMIRNQHPKATHHCYAYRLGKSGELYRTNDDGEPSGSAGLPIYNQILAQELTNVLIIVVRYYGGTKLGVSGLVKAYKECAKLALQSAIITRKELTFNLKIMFNFHQQNVIFTLLHKVDAVIQDFNSNEICTINTCIKISHKQYISDKLSEMQYVTFEFL